ncbi:hypothetical protein ACQEWB_36580 [Streptomyces sp. CA-249302]|uniref:hypothetical protein n=1 Tax=Streptomyces sp. CA-249302 TaxID=3240058 RepID=UPI003D8BCAC4
MIAIIVMRRWADQVEGSPPQSGHWRSQAAFKATWCAAKLAGERRNTLNAWHAHLEGDPANGVVLTRRQQRQYAAGFLRAALQYRLHDIAQPLWRPADWLLSKGSRTNGFIASVVGAQAIYIVDDGGIPALVTEIWEPCGAFGAGLYVLARWLRRVRGIELAAVQPPSSPEE